MNGRKDNNRGENFDEAMVHDNGEVSKLQNLRKLNSFINSRKLINSHGHKK